jgi:HD-GYP domain-containing protein (c-di-GMP phosphodiesterase class II)
LRVSVGVAAYPDDGIDRDVLVAQADARLYESKLRGEIVAPGSADGDGPHGVADAFGVLDGLVTAVDRKDRYTRAHSEEVTRLALLLGAELGLSPETLRSVRLAGLLHDVGKIGVPDRILKKPGRLTPEEIDIMNGHPALGEAIVAGLPDLAEIRTGVRSHHERWDGRGYPDGLSGEAIPLLGRLLSIPDCYSAMTTDRPYRAALSHEAALLEIQRGAGTQFDPKMSAAFLRAVRRHEPGAAEARPARSA